MEHFDPVDFPRSFWSPATQKPRSKPSSSQRPDDTSLLQPVAPLSALPTTISRHIMTLRVRGTTRSSVRSPERDAAVEPCSTMHRRDRYRCIVLYYRTLHAGSMLFLARVSLPMIALSLVSFVNLRALMGLFQRSHALWDNIYFFPFLSFLSPAPSPQYHIHIQAISTISTHKRDSTAGEHTETTSNLNHTTSKDITTAATPP